MAYYDKEKNFENFVYVILQVLIVLNSVFVPVLMWFDVSHAIQYFDKWAKFQVHW